jgi:two-component system OmpR family sensor kinase
MTFELYRVIGTRLSEAEGATATDRLPGEEVLIVQIAENLKTLRRFIAEEISLVGAAEGENEKEELERLAAIEWRVTTFIAEYHRLKTPPPGTTSPEAWRLIARSLDSLLNADLRNAIKEGIDDEKKEVETSDRRAQQLIVKSRNLTAIASGLALLLTLIGSLVLVRNLRRPLGELQAAMNDFASGDFSKRVTAFGRDEFALLGKRFNQMAEELDNRRQVSARTQSSLERTVEERTRNLADLNANLAASDQARRRFLADLSHELRTPLTIIRGESEIMLRTRGADEEAYKSALSRILDQSKHTAMLVDDLLFIARKEAGEVRLKMLPLDLGKLLKQVCNEAQPLCTEKGLHLGQPRLDITPANIIGDAARLKQVLLIMIDNGVRYSRRNGSIEVRLLEAPGGFAMIVSDDGIGIPADDLPFVFERFYRGSNVDNNTAEGVGLGLPVAKAIVEAHGGSISIESEPERGTTVTVTLPFSQASGEPRIRAVS